MKRDFRGSEGGKTQGCCVCVCVCVCVAMTRGRMEGGT